MFIGLCSINTTNASSRARDRCHYIIIDILGYDKRIGFEFEGSCWNFDLLNNPLFMLAISKVWGPIFDQQLCSWLKLTEIFRRVKSSVTNSSWILTTFNCAFHLLSQHSKSSQKLEMTVLIIRLENTSKCYTLIREFNSSRLSWCLHTGGVSVATTASCRFFWGNEPEPVFQHY